MKRQQLSESFMAAMEAISKDMPTPIRKLSGKELFLRYIELHENIRQKERQLDDAGLYIGNFSDDYYGMTKCMMHLAFNPSQVETIEWWLYEDVEKVIRWPDEGREWRLDTPEQLWDYLQNKATPATADEAA